MSAFLKPYRGGWVYALTRKGHVTYWRSALDIEHIRRVDPTVSDAERIPVQRGMVVSGLGFQDEVAP